MNDRYYSLNTLCLVVIAIVVVIALIAGWNLEL